MFLNDINCKLKSTTENDKNELVLTAVCVPLCPSQKQVLPRESPLTIVKSLEKHNNKLLLHEELRVFKESMTV